MSDLVKNVPVCPQTNSPCTEETCDYLYFYCAKQGREAEPEDVHCDLGQSGREE